MLAASWGGHGGRTLFLTFKCIFFVCLPVFCLFLLPHNSCCLRRTAPLTCRSFSPPGGFPATTEAFSRSGPPAYIHTCGGYVVNDFSCLWLRGLARQSRSRTCPAVRQVLKRGGRIRGENDYSCRAGFMVFAKIRVYNTCCYGRCFFSRSTTISCPVLAHIPRVVLLVPTLMPLLIMLLILPQTRNGLWWWSPEQESVSTTGIFGSTKQVALPVCLLSV